MMKEQTHTDFAFNSKIPQFALKEFTYDRH